jgi:hypothetical protein
MTLRVLEHALCPVLVASSASRDRLHSVEESVTPVTGADTDADGDHPARGRSDDLSTTPVR